MAAPATVAPKYARDVVHLDDGSLQTVRMTKPNPDGTVTRANVNFTEESMAPFLALGFTATSMEQQVREDAEAAARAKALTDAAKAQAEQDAADEADWREIRANLLKAYRARKAEGAGDPFADPATAKGKSKS